MQFPLGNNNLERFLIREGAEVVVPGLFDFCLFFVYNQLMEYGIYKRHRNTYLIVRIFYQAE